MDQLTRKRLERNESTFRDANERIVEAAGAIGIEGQAVPFICECADAGCTQVVLLPLPEYAAVREHARRFLHASGHLREGEHVVERHDAFDVVERRAEATDPRG